MSSGTANPQAATSPLTWQIRADMFAQLAAMENAGLPPDQALGLVRLPANLQTRVAATRRNLARGADLATAGKRTGLFTELEANLVSAATQAGSPAPTYRRLAAYYTQRAAQTRRVKSRLVLPGFTLLIGLFTQGLPALAAGNIGFGRYLFHALIPLFGIAAIVLLVKHLYQVREGPMSDTRIAVESLMLRLPLMGEMLIRRNIRDFFESLALMLEAGLPILDALPKALDTVQLGVLRVELAQVHLLVENGNTFAEALANNRFLAGSPAFALITTGESSGSLPDMLFRFAAMETDAIDHFDRQLADWLPRIIYAAVAIWVAYGILSGPGVAPNIPEELR